MHTATSIAYLSLAALLLACSDGTAPDPDPIPPPPTPSPELPQGAFQVSPATATLKPGQTFRFTTTYSGDPALVGTPGEGAWHSSDESVATVSGGIVQGVAGGQARIVATWGGFQASAIVRVVGPSKKHEEALPCLERTVRAGQLLKQVGEEWSNDNAGRLAAALALYTLLSIAPLLVIAVAVAGMAFGAEAARGQISSEISGLVGPQAGQAIEAMVARADAPKAGIWSSIVGIAVLLFGASGVFGELQTALNTIWDVKPRPGRGLRGLLRDRFLSFAMVMGVAFLLLVSLVTSAALMAMTHRFQHLIDWPWLWQGVNVVVGFIVTSALFALTFKVVPDVKVPWRDVWVGGVATALAFSLGRVALSWYVGRAATVTPFGAAGSLVALIIWVYYSAQILFFGAEFTQVYAMRRGAPVEPTPNAVPVGAP